MASLGQEKPKYLNEHNVYVRSGMATLDQLKAAVKEFKKALGRNSDPAIRKLESGEIEVNVVTNMKGETQHFGYLWVEHPEVYWILCGRNPDGTERVEIVQETKPADDIDLDNIDFSMMDLNAIASLAPKETPKIVKTLPPLIIFPGYEYTDEQRNATYKYLMEEEERQAQTEKRESLPITVPKYGYFELSRASTLELSKEQRPDILRGEVPNWVTYKMLKDTFGKFAISIISDKPTIYHEKDSRNSPIDIYNYGGHFKIKIFGTTVRNRPDYKVVTIEYPLSGYGTGIFAVQMRRKTIFANPKPATGEPKDSVCIFDYFRERKF
jgi:hypothetical protein